MEVTPPKEYRHEIKVLTPQQERQLLEAAHGERLEAVYVLPATCGLRQGECLALRFEDIDFATGNTSNQADGLAQPSVPTQDAAQPTHHQTPEDRSRRAQKSRTKQQWG